MRSESQLTIQSKIKAHLPISLAKVREKHLLPALTSLVAERNATRVPTAMQGTAEG